MSVPPAIISPVLKLKRSNDRKVANLVTKNGKQAAMAKNFHVLALLASAKASAMQENSKNSLKE
jgi:hypothetical protein